jgi:polyferredoxin
MNPLFTRRVYQVAFATLALYLTYAFFLTPTALCWLCPLYHLQLPLATKTLTTPIYIGASWDPYQVSALAFLTGIIIIALLTGRLFCGWACPFGTYLESVEKVFRRKRKELPEGFRDPSAKYVVLFLFLALTALFSQAAFCLYCPAGALFKGMAGVFVKTSVPVFIGITAAAALYGRRSWCTYLCPLGAALALAPKGHLFKIKAGDNCTRCGRCKEACPADVDVIEERQEGAITSENCTFCMECVKVCPEGVLRFP